MLKYAPTQVFMNIHEYDPYEPVISTTIHFPGKHPENCPLKADVAALELRTKRGSRWWGVTRGYINSELKMVVEIPDDTKCEIRKSWKDVPKEFEV